MIKIKGNRKANALKILSMLCVVSIIFSLFIPFAIISAYASSETGLVPVGGSGSLAPVSGSSDTYYYYPSTGDSTYTVVSLVDVADFVWKYGTSFVNSIGSHFNSDICPNSFEANGRHIFDQAYTQVDGQFGLYYICRNCHASYPCEDIRDEYHDSYDNYTADLPTSGITSTGTYVWRPKLSDIFNKDEVNFHFVSVDDIGYDNFVSGSGVYENGGSWSTYIVDDYTIYGVNQTEYYTGVSGTQSRRPIVVCPVSGTYAFNSNTLAFEITHNASTSPNLQRVYYPTRSWYKSAGATLAFPEVRASSLNSICDDRFYFYMPSIYITPSTPVNVVSGDTYEDMTYYNIDSRPTSIQGDLAYYDVSGTLNLSPSTSIVNENDNSIYNPVTNTTTDISGWTYDYTTRTYDLSTTSGDTITVTYGNENITITEGGESYTVYYVTVNEAPDTPAPTDPPTPTTTPAPTHVHDYVGVITTEPGCITAGVETYTCADCGDSYTQYIPILGHIWEEVTHTETGFFGTDDVDYIVVDGYVCQRCGEFKASISIPSPYPDHYDPSTDPPGPSHVHNYVSTVTTEPGCLTPGEAIFTCPADGDTYVGSVPAVGHDWQVKQQVHTEYDNSGELIQQGYTIYKCSRCGEEYRSDDSVHPSPPATPSPPPGSGDGDGGGGDGGLSDYTSNKLSGFSRFWEIIISFFTEFPQKFEDVTNFLVAAVPYIPEEIMYLIEFGIAMAVLVGVFKLLFR